MKSSEFDWNITDKGRKAVAEMVRAGEQEERYLNSLSPKSPDGLT